MVSLENTDVKQEKVEEEEKYEEFNNDLIEEGFDLSALADGNEKGELEI